MLPWGQVSPWASSASFLPSSRGQRPSQPPCAPGSSMSQTELASALLQGPSVPGSLSVSWISSPRPSRSHSQPWSSHRKASEVTGKGRRNCFLWTALELPDQTLPETGVLGPPACWKQSSPCCFVSWGPYRCHHRARQGPLSISGTSLALCSPPGTQASQVKAPPSLAGAGM